MASARVMTELETKPREAAGQSATISCPGSPIFIGGQRRSGTTLMRTMLGRHPHIARVPESHFFQRDEFELFFTSLLTRYQPLFERLRVGTAEMDSAVAAFIDSLFTHHRLRRKAHRWVEKSPENILRIDYLFRLFPKAHFIHMIRDPRDSLCSMKEQAASVKPNWREFTAPVTAAEWVRCIAAGLAWRDRQDRYLGVRYEDLVRQPKATLERTLVFLEEPWSSHVLDPEPPQDGGTKGQNDHKPIFTSSIGRWRSELDRAEVMCIQTIAGETMARLGYGLEVGE